MIAVDDLRPDISGPYGQHVQTPNIDRLAATGTTFARAYCQVALCSPSRTSLLTGLRPDTTRVWEIGPYFRETMAPEAAAAVVTLPQRFREAGYHTVGAGKVFHPGVSSGGLSSSEGGGDGGWPFLANGSWSAPYFFCDQFYNGTFQSPAMQDWPGARAARAGCVQSAACVDCLTAAGTISADGKQSHSGADCDASCYPDGAVADEAVRLAHGLASDASKRPFFLAVGFKRPHLGWMAPQSFFDMYNASTTAVAKHRTPPAGMPAPAWSGNGELCGMSDVKCTKNADGYALLPDARHAEMRAAYYSVVTFMDSQLGRVLDAFDATALRQQTVVAFWGDHGYQLGEHGLWCKVTNFELAARVPLVIAIPNQPNAGSVTRGLASLIDVYPTLLDAAGLPPNPANEGRSLLPLIHEPVANRTLEAFNASFTQFWRDGVMGLSVRTDAWRFTRWGPFNRTSGRPIFDGADGKVFYELYDHRGDSEDDFDAFENVNLATDKAHQQTVHEMKQLLERVWDRSPGERDRESVQMVESRLLYTVG